MEVLHHLLQVGGFGFGNLRFLRFVDVVAEEFREQVFDGLAFRIAHGVHRRIGALRHHLQFEPVTAAVALDDAANLPEAQVVEEVTTRDAYLAYEQLVDVVGGGQFFPLFPFPSSATFAASVAGRW